MGERTRQGSLRHYRCWLLVVCVCFLGGCSTVGYYYQSARGQLDLICRARDIDDVLKDEKVDPGVRRKLEHVVQIRRFASRALHLPDNGSYTRYTDLERDHAVWTVFAAPRLSIRPQEWCFPVVGCVVYRGYFRAADARRYAESLEQRGLDTYVAGVPAYSTLGWFDDPVLSTVLRFTDTELARLIIHELVHHVVYVKDDTVFNESFATAVEIEGVERWLRSQGRHQDVQAFRRERQRDEAVIDLIFDYRNRLENVYQTDRARAWKLEQKAELLAALKDHYARMVRGWKGYEGYANWFAQDLSNAHFAVIVAYHDKVAAFQALMARHDGDLSAFYDAVVELSRQPEDRRNAVLDRLLNGARPSTDAAPVRASLHFSGTYVP